MGAVEIKHGMFGWADLMTKDAADAKAFYQDLFGWTPHDVPAGPGHVYTLWMQGDDLIAGTSEMMPEMKASGMPAVWSSYIMVDDVDAIAERVPALGGSIVMPPMDVLDSGRMAVIQDPSGGTVSFWEARNHKGATLMGEPNSMAWNELLTRAPEPAMKFFTELLGWDYQDMDMGEMGIYHVITVGDQPGGGLMMMPAEVPAQVPPHWEVYFAVEDVDAKVAKVIELGGTVMVPATDISVGRFAGVMDRGGAMFTLFKGKPE